MSINAAVQCHHKLNSVEKEKYVPFVFYLIVWKKNYFLFSSYAATLYNIRYAVSFCHYSHVSLSTPSTSWLK